MSNNKRWFWGAVFCLYTTVTAVYSQWWVSLLAIPTTAWLFWPTFWRKREDRVLSILVNRPGVQQQMAEAELQRSIRAANENASAAAYAGVNRAAIRPPAYNTTPPPRRRVSDMDDNAFAEAVDLLGMAVDSLSTSETSSHNTNTYDGGGGHFGGAGASGDYSAPDSSASSSDTSYDGGSNNDSSGADGGSSGGGD